MTTELRMKNPGVDRSVELVRELSEMVRQNWRVIFLGATRLGVAIESDGYAPERVQLGQTRLHQHRGVKYANGWKHDTLVGPSDTDIRETVKSIQVLVDEGAREVGTRLRAIQVVD